MSPLVRDGDVVLVRPADLAAVRIGDVVLVPGGPGRVVVHRIVGRRAGPDGVRFLVQGDQAPGPDGLIPAASVYGQVAAIERGGVRVDMDRPAMSLLSGLAVLRSRWNLGRGGRSRLARRLVKRLPGLSRYLA